jgi:chromosome segregation ATPase
MLDILDREYKGDAKKSVRDLRTLLSKFDSVDALELEIKARMDKEIEKHGPTSARLKRMQAELDDLKVQRQVLSAKAKELRELALATPEAPAGPQKAEAVPQKAEVGG